MPPLLNDSIQSQVREVFGEQLKHPVEVIYFSQKENCDYCDDTRKLLEEVTALSPRLHLSHYDLDANPEMAAKYRVDKAPVTVFAGRETDDPGSPILDYGIQFSGIPAGHEFSSLIQTLLLVSGRDSGLDENTRAFLKTLTKPIHLQVFVTPT